MQLNKIVGVQYSCELFKKVVRVYVLIKPKEIHHIEVTPLSQMGSFDPTLPMVQPKHLPQCQPKIAFYDKQN